MRDAKQPGAERRIALESLEAVKYPDQYFLVHIFGIVRIPHQAPARTQYPALVRPHEHRKPRCDVGEFVLRALDELPLGFLMRRHPSHWP